MTHRKSMSTDSVLQSMISDFCRRTGYSGRDILSLSALTKLFLTRNGGKYRVRKDEIEHIAGPSPDPSERM